MEIKNIDQFTIDECKKYLSQNSNGVDVDAVKKRLNKLYQQELNRLHHIEWIDINQFIYQTNYLAINKVAKVLKSILMLCLIFCCLNLVISGYVVVTGDYIDNIIIEYLSNVELINYDYNNYCYSVRFDDYGLVTWFCPIIIIPCVIALINNFLCSPTLSMIYNIEKANANKKILRVQNRSGKLGLCSCEIAKIKELLPFNYDRIYPCGSDAFICEIGAQKGVYNTTLHKMTIQVGYKNIEILNKDKLKITVGKNAYIFTTKGFRVIS